MQEPDFKNGMARMRDALATPGNSANRTTMLCMVIAGTRGHLHAQGVWRKCTGWAQVIPDLTAQRAFLAEFGNKLIPTFDGRFERVLSEEEQALALALLDAADEWRARPVPAAVEAEETVPVAAVV